MRVDEFESLRMFLAPFRVVRGPEVEDKRPRKRQSNPVRSIVLHTTTGQPKVMVQVRTTLLPGSGPLGEEKASAIIRWWNKSPRKAGAHIIVCQDGTVVIGCDLLRDVAFHAGSANEHSIGIEMIRGPDLELYEDQIEATTRLVDWLTMMFEIPRRFVAPYMGPAILHSGRILSFQGVLGHRDITNNRGYGDPGDEVFEALEKRGYEIGATVEALDDIHARRCAVFETDVVPLSKVAGEIRAPKFPQVWVHRPVDYLEVAQADLQRVREAVREFVNG